MHSSSIVSSRLVRTGVQRRQARLLSYTLRIILLSGCSSKVVVIGSLLLYKQVLVVLCILSILRLVLNEPHFAEMTHAKGRL